MGTKKAPKTAWKKGKSGNPNGRPPAIPIEVKTACREHTVDAIDTLAKIMKDKTAPQTARIAAANSILDRGYGKPAQTVNVKRKDDVKELSDAELYAIASSAGTHTAQGSEEQPNKVH